MGLLPLFTTLLIAAAPADAGDKQLHWVGCDISKLSFMDTVAAAYEKKTGVKINLVDGGATRGIREVVAKKADIGGTCRHAENVPEEQGVRLIPVAWDALVVAVHPSNPVNEITLDQVKGIFLGKLTNWKQLGGPDRPIVAMERKGTLSGVGAGARELIFKDRKLQYHASVKLYES
ncbi:MAG TPA: substrate-binding domain-containing protein, partial [Myxococcaceae bacterium]